MPFASKFIFHSVLYSPIFYTFFFSCCIYAYVLLEQLFGIKGAGQDIVVYFVFTLKLTPGTYIGGGAGFLETSLSLAFACDSFIEQIECIAK